MAKIWNFGNGRLICILLKMLKNEGGIIQILDQRPPEKQKLQKSFVGTPNQGTPKKSEFHCRTSGED